MEGEETLEAALNCPFPVTVTIFSNLAINFRMHTEPGKVLEQTARIVDMIDNITKSNLMIDDRISTPSSFLYKIDA